ncbi:tetratricopeptide repeat protein [Paraburkholderia sp. SIMBA_054]|uniref:tetratricopeptide repeat protein n=1 Tax=Paraburkholderia sp. SIMBA_054 TaxID=3085795 RepID=UPI00397ADC50
MSRRGNTHTYSIRRLQSLLGVSRRVVIALVEAGFVDPERGRRNEMRFSFRDVVLLRTAYKLQNAKIPTRKILRSLAAISDEMPAGEVSLAGLRISAVGNEVAVGSGPARWVADSRQMLLDFGSAPVAADVSFLGRRARVEMDRASLADEWYERAERLREEDFTAAEQAYRKAIELSPAPHYSAYTNLGVHLCEDEGRCADALAVFDAALRLFPDDTRLLFNRGVALEQLHENEAAALSYERCLAIDPEYIDAHFNLARLKQLRGDEQGVLRHLSAYRRLGGI